MVRCEKTNNLIFFLLFAIEMAVLSVFLEKKGLGPLGVNHTYFIYLKICIVYEYG